MHESSERHGNLSQALPSSFLARLEKANLTSSFVVDAAGKVTNEQGNSKGLGNDSDLLLLKTFRQHAQVVLTSGLTARVESYRMPGTADLAIFTKRGVQELGLQPKAEQQLLILTPPQVASYDEALEALLRSYSRVHVEFGPTGIGEILNRLDLVAVSGTDSEGVAKFVAAFGLDVVEQFELPKLFVTLGVGRGKGSIA